MVVDKSSLSVPRIAVFQQEWNVSERDGLVIEGTTIKVQSIDLNCLFMKNRLNYPHRRKYHRQISFGNPPMGRGGKGVSWTPKGYTDVPGVSFFFLGGGGGPRTGRHPIESDGFEIRLGAGKNQRSGDRFESTVQKGGRSDELIGCGPFRRVATWKEKKEKKDDRSSGPESLPANAYTKIPFVHL